MSKSISKIPELGPLQARELTRLLQFDPKPFPHPSRDRDPTPEQVIFTWLGRQYHCLKTGLVPEALMRPKGFRPNTIGDLIALHLPNNWGAPKAILCDSHKRLNPWLIRRIFVQIMGECSMRLEYLYDLAYDLQAEEAKRSRRKAKGKINENENEDDDMDKNGHRKIKMSQNIQDWLNRMLSVNALWLSKRLFADLYPTVAVDMPNRFPLPHDESDCEACILSYIGGNSQIIFDFGVSLRGRRPRGKALQSMLLWPLIDSWSFWLGETKEMQEQAATLGKDIRKLRKKLQKKRHAKRSSRHKTTSTAITNDSDSLKHSTRPLSPRKNDVDLEENSADNKNDADHGKNVLSRFKEHRNAPPNSPAREVNAGQTQPNGHSPPVEENNNERRARYDAYLDYINDPVVEKADDEAEARYREYVESMNADLDNTNGEYGESQTEQDERDYQDNILFYYRNQPSKSSSIIPAPGDAYGAGTYMPPNRFNPNIKRYTYYVPTVGSDGWEDVEVEVEEESPHPTLCDMDTEYVPLEQEVKNYHTATPPAPRKRYSEYVPPKISKPLPPKPRKDSTRSMSHPVHLERDTVTSRYSNASFAYKPYVPPDFPRDLALRGKGAVDSREYKTRSIAGLATKRFNDKQPSSLTQAAVLGRTAEEEESSEMRNLAEERANAYRALVGESEPSSLLGDKNSFLNRMNRMNRSSYSPIPQPPQVQRSFSNTNSVESEGSSESKQSSLRDDIYAFLRHESSSGSEEIHVPPKPLAARSILSCYDAKYEEREKHVTWDNGNKAGANIVTTKAKSKKPSSTVETDNDTDAIVNLDQGHHWPQRRSQWKTMTPPTAPPPNSPLPPLPRTSVGPSAEAPDVEAMNSKPRLGEPRDGEELAWWEAPPSPSSSIDKQRVFDEADGSDSGFQHRRLGLRSRVDGSF